MKKVLVYATMFGLGAALTLLLYHPKARNNSPNESTLCTYKYINPLRCGAQEFDRKAEHKVFQEELRHQIETLQENGEVTNVSVFFRDLESGPIFYINEDTQYAPASLLKNPIMITYFKKAETEPQLLSEQIEVKELPPGSENDPFAETSLKPGTYTVEELIDFMIINSDNAAKEILINYMEDRGGEKNFLVDTFFQLGMIGVSETSSDIVLTVKEHAALFRLLYNAAYLSPDMSDKALSLLSQATFNSGLTANLPDNIVVAHKYGIKGLEGNQVQLHECGIFYHPESPYILCVMTQGDDLDKLSNILSNIGKKVYDEVSNPQEQ